jgi:CheY-like chemotaxis protein
MRGRILVVDNDETVRELLRLQLTAAGHIVECAADAIEAGHAILRQPPDLVLCEVELPFLSGAEFAAALKADPSIPRVPVLFMVALENAEAHLEVVGDSEYVTKPVHTGRLLNVVTRRLQLRAA